MYVHETYQLLIFEIDSTLQPHYNMVLITQIRL